MTKWFGGLRSYNSKNNSFWLWFFSVSLYLIYELVSSYFLQSWIQQGHEFNQRVVGFSRLGCDDESNRDKSD